MPIALPSDFDLLQGAAIVILFLAWFTYSAVLMIVARGSLNEQLSTVRTQWLRLSIGRGQKPFDAILLGHIVNSIAFFGSVSIFTSWASVSCSRTVVIGRRPMNSGMKP